MTKNEFIAARTAIISRMLDNTSASGIHPTTRCYAELDDLFDELTGSKEGPSWAQIETETKPT